jgi:hypothetical protein
MRLDLKPVGSDAAPHPRPVCPKSHFVLYQGSSRRMKSPGCACSSGPRTTAPQSRRAAHTVLLAKIREYEQAKPAELAFHLLKALWEVQSDLVEWRRCAEASLICYEKALASRPQAAPIDATDVLQAELSRRLSRFDSAQRNLDSLFARPCQPDTLLRQILEYERKVVLEADRFPHEIPRADQ